MSILTEILSNIDSTPCVSCSLELPSKYGLCQECYEKLPIIHSPHCPGCGGENDGIFEVCGKCLQEESRPWDNAAALMRMENVGRDLIHSLKYGNKPAVARTFGELVFNHCEAIFEDVDYITPIPLHWSRTLMRGYNQSELFAQIMAKSSNIPFCSILKRIKMTPQQANLNQKERKKNLIGAFSVKKEAICKNCTILLVDDVMTTGTTLTSATLELLHGGAKKVKILVLARA